MSTRTVHPCADDRWVADVGVDAVPERVGPRDRAPVGSHRGRQPDPDSKDLFRRDPLCGRGIPHGLQSLRDVCGLVCRARDLSSPLGDDLAAKVGHRGDDAVPTGIDSGDDPGARSERVMPRRRPLTTPTASRFCTSSSGCPSTSCSTPRSCAPSPSSSKRAPASTAAPPGRRSDPADHPRRGEHLPVEVRLQRHRRLLLLGPHPQRLALRPEVGHVGCDVPRGYGQMCPRAFAWFSSRHSASPRSCFSRARVSRLAPPLQRLRRHHRAPRQRSRTRLGKCRRRCRPSSTAGPR